MSEKGYLIDAYLEAGRPEVPERAQWAVDAYVHYGLTPDTSVAHGTRVLDMYGIDTRLPTARKAKLPLDLDVVVTRPELTRLNRENPPDYGYDDMDRVLAPPLLFGDSRRTQVGCRLPYVWRQRTGGQNGL